LNRLREENCDEVQGYFFSRPRPADEIPSLIKKLQRLDYGGRPTDTAKDRAPIERR